MRIAPQLPPGLAGNDTVWSRRGSWRDASHVRFDGDTPVVIPGWELFMPETLTGVCRALFAWTDAASIPNVAFGTHQRLQVWKGGGFVDITPTVGFNAGAEHGAGQAGYGSGAYSTGEYSEPSTTDYFPLTWSLSAYGQNLIANPRGEGVFRWQNDVAVRAALLPNAPTKAAYALTTPQNTILALGCQPEGASAANPLCIRECDPADPTVWATTVSNLARSKILRGGGRLIAGRVVGLESVYAWTDNALHQGVWTGDPDTPRVWYEVAQGCGLIAPGAAAVSSSQTAYWQAPDGQFWRCALGGAPEALACPILDDAWSNLALSQRDKITAAGLSRHGEVWWFYPDRRDGEGLEVSRALILNTRNGAWSKSGPQAAGGRSAFADAAAGFSGPLGVTPAGVVYAHEQGHSADGEPLKWRLETNAFALGDGEHRLLVTGVLPDIEGQQGPIAMTLYGRGEAQAAETSASVTLIPGQGEACTLIEARAARWRLEGGSSPAGGRIGLFGFEVRRGGRR